MNLKTHRKLVSVSCLLFALLTFANTNGENQEGSSRTRNRSKRQIVFPAELPRNCYDVLLSGETQSGVYTIYPIFSEAGVNVYCDLQTEGGGWTVFLQRNQQNPQLNFVKSFNQYAQGFGDANGEYWLGNNILHAITLYTDFTLRVKAKNFEDEVRTAEWGYFKVGDGQSIFKLSLSNYNKQSTLGDGMNPAAYSGRNSSADRPFSAVNKIDPGTPDQCLFDYGNGGWWYNDCLGVNPTAPLSNNPNKKNRATWFYWNTGSGGPSPEGPSPEGLSEIQFKIRPNFLNQ